MAVEYGLGEKTGETDAGTEKYENGKVSANQKAMNHALEEFGHLPPRMGVAAALLEGTGYKVTEAGESED